MLHPDFLRLPIAHRGYHHRPDGRIENSLSAINAAIEAGYGIEIDIQPSADGVPMVFHDYALGRLTGERGPIAQRTAAELGRIALSGSEDTIPTFVQVLDTVAGKVPLLVEIKDQDGALGKSVGALEQAVAKSLADYRGPVAVMSFNPNSIAVIAELAPDIPRGLTTCLYEAADWPTIPAGVRNILATIPDYDRTGACFVSHQHDELDCPRIHELRDAGATILCWTIRNRQDEQAARTIAHNVTFEGYPA